MSMQIYQITLIINSSEIQATHHKTARNVESVYIYLNNRSVNYYKFQYSTNQLALLTNNTFPA